MADKKISALTPATTPLAGTEELPIVQGGSTVKVSVNNLTAGKAVTAVNISNGLGAVSTPSYTFNGDLDTGIWSPAADTLAVSTSGAERLRIDSSGNVGIGTSAPGGTLDVARSAAAAVVNITSGANVFQLFENTAGDASLINYTSGRSVTISQAGAGFINFGVNGAERLRIDSSGNVGIGTSAPNAAARLDVSSTTNGFLPPRMTEAQRDLIATPPDGLMLYNTTTNKLQVRAAGVWVDLH